MSDNKGKRIYGQRISDEQPITVTLCNVFWNTEEDGKKSLALSHRDTRLRTIDGQPLDKQFTSIRFYEGDVQNLDVLITELQSFSASVKASQE